LPFVTLYFTNVLANWYPKDIDAYHAIKITNICLTIRVTGATTAQIAVGFDEVADSVLVAGNTNSQLAFTIGEAGARTAVIVLNNIDKIIGDYISAISSNATAAAAIVIFYEVIPTKFDEYGQVSKSFKRAFTD